MSNDTNKPASQPPSGIFKPLDFYRQKLPYNRFYTDPQSEMPKEPAEDEGGQDE